MELIYNQTMRKRPARPPLEPADLSEADLPSAGAARTVVTRMDPPLLMTTVALVLFGLLAVYTASAHQAQTESGNALAIFLKQAVSAGLGLVVMLFCARMNFQFWRRAARPMGCAALLLLLVTLGMGQTVNGSERWIPLPFGLQFQPSDFAKIAAIALMAQATSQRRLFNLHLFVNLVLIGLMVLLILKQPNLSVSLILLMLTGMMMFVAGMPGLVFLLCLPPVVYGIGVNILKTPYQMRRIEGWLNPWKDPQDAGYNLIQSWYAIGSGGLFGVGLGHSVQKLYYLPFQHTDFIFAVICEELGLLGAVTVIGLFAILAWRGFAIAFHCPSPFGQMLAFGLTAAILLQAIINISVTVGLMPVTGVTLPLISYGGTSMIMTLAMIGILLNISRYRLGPA